MRGTLSPNLREALNANIDVLGQQVLADGEPSFERVAPIFPPLSRTRANVGVAEHPLEIGVAWDGTIELSRKVSFRIGDPPSPYGFDGPPRQSLLKGYLPVVITQWQYGDLAYTLSVFGHSKGMQADQGVSAYAELEIRNPTNENRNTRITAYSFPALGGSLPTFDVDVPAESRTSLHFRIPYDVKPETLVQQISDEEYLHKLAENNTAWTKILDTSAAFVTPERRVNEAQRAWLMYNFLNVDMIDGRCQPHDGGRFYENVYGYSAALYFHALSLYGYWEHAERYMTDFLQYQQKDGQFRTSYGTPDNGAFLFAVGQHYRMTRHNEWFAQMTPAIQRCCEWIAQSRTKTIQGDKKSLTYGLLASGDKPYADYPGEVFSYYVDCYSWLGLRETGLAMREAGMADEAERWLTEADAYRKCILRSMERSLVDKGKFKALPMEPLTQRLIKQGGGDYYGIIAPMMLETDFFMPKDERSKWVTIPMEQLGGLMLGVSRFADGIDHAYTYGYAMTKLRQGEADAFLLAFYTSLAHGMDRDTYSSVEVNHAPLGVNDPTLPHLYSHTQQLRWLRMMLVREEGEELWLASGMPRAWLTDDRTLRVRNAPTLFGRISYDITSDPANGRMDIQIDPLERQGHALPKRAVFMLRAPKKLGPMKTLIVNDEQRKPSADGRISLDATLLNAPVKIVATFR